MLREKGWIYVKNRLHLYFPLKFLTNIPILKANNEWRLYYKYSRKYKKVLQTCDLNREDFCQERSPKSFKIWTLWLQGENQAPPLVKKCFAQMRIIYGEEQLVVLDEQTISQYVNLPNFILEKYHKGNISNAHYSDIIRTFLLCSYGGIWIDATCYLTDKLPEEIFNSKLCVFKTPQCYPGAIKASSWFILSEKNSVTMQLVKALLVAYWKNNNHIEDYLLFHIFFSIAVDYTKASRLEWSNMPYYNNDNTHIMKRELLTKYDKERYENLCRISSIHKLSWKIHNTSANTLYSFICK